MATSTSGPSLFGVATRVIARTFEYDSCPAANAAVVTGRSSSARATRT